MADSAAPASNTVKTLESADDVSNAIKNSKPSVILINTPGGIGLSSIISGVYSQVAAQVQAVDFYYVDAEAHKDIADQYEATAFPTVLVYKDGNLLQAVKGFTDVASLSNAVGAINQNK